MCLLTLSGIISLILVEARRSGPQAVIAGTTACYQLPRPHTAPSASREANIQRADRVAREVAPRCDRKDLPYVETVGHYCVRPCSNQGVEA